MRITEFMRAAAAVPPLSDGQATVRFAAGEGHVAVEAAGREPGRGGGALAAAMSSACILADGFGVVLRAIACPGSGSCPAHDPGSEGWYARMGFRRAGTTAEGFPDMERMPGQVILYHSSPAESRDAIAEGGLRLSASEAAAVAREAGDPGWEKAGAVFLSSKPEEGGRVDVWEVEASGLGMAPDDTTECPDTEDSWWMVFEDIPAERLRLFLPACGRAIDAAEAGTENAVPGFP